MTRTPQPHLIEHHISRRRRHFPYTVPDIARFRLPRADGSGHHNRGTVNMTNTTNIDEWIQTTIPDSQDSMAEMEPMEEAPRPNTPTQVNALDVVHNILNRPVDSDGSVDENIGDDRMHDENNDDADLGIFDQTPGPRHVPWVPNSDPGNIYAASDASAFGGDDDGEYIGHSSDGDTNGKIPAGPSLSMTPTEFKFALFLSEFQLSRRAWRALCEIIVSSPYQDLLKLPKWKPTLMDKFAKQLPKCAMRRRTVELNADKLPNRSSPVEDLVWIDMEGFISRLLAAPLHRQHIYQGLGQLTRFTTEFWHTRAWGESNKQGEYVLPSDFVRFMCENQYCWCHRTDQFGGHIMHHLGRVTYCGLDKTGRFPENHPIALIAPAYEQCDLPPEAMIDFMNVTHSSSFEQVGHGVVEVILVQGEELLIPAENITTYVDNVFIDYEFDPKIEGDYIAPTTEGSVVRFIWNKLELQRTNRYPFIPARMTNPHRAELEMKIKPRSAWIHDFTAKPSISLPWKMFVDAFGLYRNMYRSMTGVYPLPAFYPDRIANRRSSVTPLTVGLFGMDTSDLLDELSQINYLAMGHDMDVDRKRIHVCSFTMCFVGDFPQQQELSGCKDHKALQPCRFCMIPKALRQDLNYNVIEFGRYHNEILSIREKVSHMTVGRRNKKLKDFGLKEDARVAEAASTLAPGIDLLRGRPIDAAHSEFTSLVKSAQRILVDEIINKKSHSDFIKAFQQFPLPPRFHRIQSPIAHMDSWRMQECTEASIITPVMLHFWLTDTHIQPNFFTTFRRETSNPQITKNSIHLLLLFWNIARSNLLVFGRYPPQLTDNSFMNVVYRGRRSLQLLFHVAAYSCGLRSKRKGPGRLQETVIDTDNDDDDCQSSVISDFTRVSHVSEGPDIGANSDTNVRTLSGKAKMLAYSRLKELPNIHQGLHLWEVARQFGACRMVNTLLGEDQHKRSKSEVLATNHRLVSETLIQRINTRESIDFGFAGAFENTFSDIHGYFQEIGEQCPSLRQRIELDEDENDTDGKLRVVGDDAHIRPLVALTMKRKVVVSRTDPLLNILQPNKLNLQNEFIVLLMKAYENDYNCIDVVNFGMKRLRWVGCLSFSTVTSQRICVRVNDFIRTSHDMQLARVDGIFTHRYHLMERVFVVVTFVEHTDKIQENHLLGCPTYHIGDARIIIGLPAILPSEYWIVRQEDGSFLSLPHDIYTI
ncbi:hypothetical protein GGS21DRAFT_541457 [Xylaria nigripes]|nr:hypothetical protein GGS21DRAFT_541457 [Xylaria nigripes]